MILTTFSIYILLLAILDISADTGKAHCEVSKDNWNHQKRKIELSYIKYEELVSFAVLPKGK